MFPSNPFPILVICQAQELLSSFQVFDVEGTGHSDRPGVGQIIAWQHVTTFQLVNRGSKAQRKIPVSKKILGSCHSEKKQEVHCIQNQMHIKGPHRTWI